MHQDTSQIKHTDCVGLVRFGSHGPALSRAGWDVIPLPPGRKAPNLKGWQRGFSNKQADQFASNEFNNGNIGLLAKNFPGVDIDVSDAACAEAIQSAAEEILGAAPVRFGSAPKRLLMYRTDKPFNKVKVFLEAPDGSTKDEKGKDYAIEFLGNGQQYVIHGRHPDGIEYQWPGNDSPTNNEVWDLPVITEEQAKKFIYQLKQRLPPGWKVRTNKSLDRISQSSDHFSQHKLPVEGWDVDRVRHELMPYLTNYDDHGHWIEVGMALHHQFEGAIEALNLWDFWSKQSVKWSAGVCAKRWNSFSKQRFEGNGAITLASLIKQVRDNTKSSQLQMPRPRFTLIHVGQLISKPADVKYLIDQILEENALGVFVGESQTYKSFCAIDAAACIATGTPWHGRITSQGSVIYVAGEGHSGLSRRMKAWEINASRSLEEAPLYFSTAPISMMDPKSIELLIESVDAIAAENGPPKLVVIDTVHRNFGDGDENGTKDWARVFQHLDALRIRYGCSILLVHHTGHNSSDRGRGSSSLRAGLDFEFLFSRVGSNQVQVKCMKAKDSEPPPPIGFKSVSVDLPWLDKNKRQMTSLVLEEIEPPKLKPKPLSGTNRIAFEALRRVLRTISPEVGNDIVPRAWTDASSWLEAALADGICDSSDPDSRGRSFRRAKKYLLEEGLVVCKNERYTTDV